MSQPKSIRSQVTDEKSIVRSSIPLQVLCHIHRPIIFLVKSLLFLFCQSKFTSYLSVVRRRDSHFRLERTRWLAIGLDNLWFRNLCSLFNFNIGISSIRINHLR